MSTISASGLTSGSSITSTGSTLQITGLASGLDTNSIIQALLSIEKQPITNLTSQQSGLTALNTHLTSIQSGLRTLALDAQALSDPGLFANTQTVSSSNSALVSATTATGAGSGGYQVGVTQLANSAQRTFTFTSPTSPDTITIDGKPVATQLAAGASITDFVNAINSDANASVYAAATDTGTVVLSNRATGDTGASYIQVSDTGGALTQKLAADGVTPIAREGQDAHYTVDGVDGSSASNTVTGAIAGVTLNLAGLTTSTANGVTSSSSVTVNVSAPAPSTAGIQSTVKTFVDAYNSMLDQINANLTQKPSTSDPTLGGLFGDNELTNLLNDMRSTMYSPAGMYSPGSGVPAFMASLADIGISTGAASGASPFSQDSVSGKLTIDSTALANAIQANPGGVKGMLQNWSQSFATVVNREAQAGGSLDARITGDSSEISDIGTKIDSLNTMLTARQTALTAQFAKLEATLSTLQQQNSWLGSALNSLPLPASL
jgi:flagellar hook-associated protein 2